jgi:hypothetical protein
VYGEDDARVHALNLECVCVFVCVCASLYLSLSMCSYSVCLYADVDDQARVHALSLALVAALNKQAIILNSQYTVTLQGIRILNILRYGYIYWDTDFQECTKGTLY